jgi:hypothetical protein
LNGLAAIPAWMGGDLLKGIFERTATFDAVKAGLLGQGFTPAQANAAAEASFATQRNTLGTSALGNIDLVSKLMAVVQDPNEAIKLMPDYARLGVLLNVTGHGDEGSELMDAIRAGEFRGALSRVNPTTGKPEINMEGLSTFLNEMTATNSVSHGQIGPAAILQFLRASGGAAGALIDDKELFAHTIALQMALGPGRAGTALQAFEQQFTAGRMSQATANMLIQMGIIRGGGTTKTNPFVRSNGPFNVILKPGAMDPGMQEEAFRSPVDFVMQYLAPRMQEYLHKSYGKTYDNADDKTKLAYETAVASQISSRIPGGTEISEIIRNILIIGRDTGAFDRAMTRDNFGIAAGNNPMLRQMALIAAYQAAETRFGETAMPQAIRGLDGVTDSLNGLSTWATEHGTITRLGLEGLAGAVLGLGAAGVIAILGTLGGATGLLAALGAGITILYSALNSQHSFLDDLEEQMQKNIPGLKSFDDWMKQHGPFGGAANPPGGGDHPEGNRDTNPLSAPNGVPHPGPLFGPQQSYAPTGGTTAGSGSSGPVPVVVTNGRDLIRGVSSGQASLLNRPQSGYSGSDPTIDPSSAFYGIPTP